MNTIFINLINCTIGLQKISIVKINGRPLAIGNKIT